MGLSIANVVHMKQPPTPIAFRADFECPAVDEAETTAALIAAIKSARREAPRNANAKAHGLLIAELHVHDGLPDALAQGLFARAAVYPVVLRLSTASCDLLDDAPSSARGLALKVVGVQGEALSGSESGATQDFVSVNSPSCTHRDPKAWLDSVRRRVAGKAPGQASPAATHILGETFYGQLPLLYGRYIAKVAVVPVLPSLTALTGMSVDVEGRRDALRDAVVAYFTAHDAVWALRVQLCTDLERMPIEDASVAWPESLSPFVTVATLRAAAQPAWNEARERSIEGAMSFNPWNALAAHRPLGGLMRVRQAVYAATESLRGQQLRGGPAGQSPLLQQLAASVNRQTE